MAGTAKSAGTVAVLVAMGLVVAASASAQSHTSTFGHPAGRIAPRVRPVPIRPGSTVGTPLNPNFAPIGTVPGLSFNIQALAAADRHRRGRRGEVVTPFLWYAPYYSPYLDYDETPEPPYDYSEGQPQAYPYPQGYPYPRGYGYPRSVPPPTQPSEPVPPPANAEPQAPLPDVGQFVLVRLDGQVIFASAFMVANGRVTYVTREGIRRSFPISELDKDATRQMNEANGTSVSLPD